MSAGNPTWKKGGPSPNPNGRKKMKNSALTVKGKVERFIKANLNQRQLQRMYDELPARDQFKVLTELMPYILPKQNSLTADLTADINFDNLSDRDLDALYNKVTETISFEMVPNPDNLFPELTDEQVKQKIDAYIKKYGIPEEIERKPDYSKLTDEELETMDRIQDKLNGRKMLENPNVLNVKIHK
jgi:hypothetical protein